MAGAEWVDVQATTARVACVDRELEGAAAPPDVHEDAFHALLMEFVVVAEAHQVLQQAFLVDLRAAVADLHAAPVGLARDQAVALEQVADQGLGDGAFFMVGAQQLRGGLVLRALHIQAVQQQAVELLHHFLVEAVQADDLHADASLLLAAAPQRFGQVGAQACLDFGRVGQAGVVEAVEVELERLALDEIGGLAGNREMHERHLRLAAQVEPGQLEGRPQVGAEEGHLSALNADFFALGRAGQGEQQRGGVLVDVGGAFAQLGLFGSIHGKRAGRAGAGQAWTVRAERVDPGFEAN